MKHKLFAVAAMATALTGWVGSANAATTQDVHNTNQQQENLKQSEVPEKFEPTWMSLTKYQVPEWWRDMKFGIYFHWGPYSVPAEKSAWYAHWMYEDGHPLRKWHEQTYGPLWKFGYKDFIKDLTGEHFDAMEWVKLFKEAGAQFAGPVVEHSDGFAMYDSDLTHWDCVEMGPKRDITGEMRDAVKAHGLKFIVTYHRHWLYAWYPTWNRNMDCGDPKYRGLYGPKVPKGAFEMGLTTEEKKHFPDNKFNQEWLDRLEEIMDKYQPDIIWHDNKMDIIGEDYRQKFLADYYNKAKEWGKEVVVTYKANDLAKGSAVLDLERSRMSDMKPFPWLSDDSIDWKTWCHVKEPHYKTTDRLIDFLVDCVSKNGAVLLNVTPRADGVMPEGVVKRLKEMGAWMRVNGEAIYGTRPWKIYGEGPQKIVEGHLSEDQNEDAGYKDIRFTTKGEKLYAIALGWPANNKLCIRSLKKGNKLLTEKITGIRLLGDNQKIRYKQTDKGLELRLPKKHNGAHAFTFEILRK